MERRRIETIGSFVVVMTTCGLIVVAFTLLDGAARGLLIGLAIAAMIAAASMWGQWSRNERWGGPEQVRHFRYALHGGPVPPDARLEEWSRDLRNVLTSRRRLERYRHLLLVAGGLQLIGALAVVSTGTPSTAREVFWVLMLVGAPILLMAAPFIVRPDTRRREALLARLEAIDPSLSR